MHERERAIESIRGHLQRRMSPRKHMLALVGLTGACGFLSSYLLLHAGVRSMAIRYPAAVVLAYIVFIGLISLWLRRYRLRVRAERETSKLDFDVVDVPLDQLFSDAPVSGGNPAHFGGGGGFSGGGGGTSWGEGSLNVASVAHASMSHGAPIADHGSGGDLNVDLDDGALWLVPVGIVTALALGGAIYVVYLAPGLLAELLLDAGLAAGLYARLIKVEKPSWLGTAVRTTVGPACLVAVSLSIAGAVMQTVYPDAASIGVVVNHLVAPTSRPSP